MSLTQDLRWSLGRSIVLHLLQLQRQTDLFLCTINCFLQWDHLPSMAVGDLAFYYTLYLCWERYLGMGDIAINDDAILLINILPFSNETKKHIIQMSITWLMSMQNADAFKCQWWWAYFEMNNIFVNAKCKLKSWFVLMGLQELNLPNKFSEITSTVYLSFPKMKRF